MKNKITLLAAAVLLTNCAILNKDSTEVQKANDVYKLSYMASSIGISAALKQKPEWKDDFNLAYSSLDVLVNNKKVTGILLREIISKLPIRELKSENAKIVIDNATMLFDLSIGDKINIEDNIYVMAASKGIRDGMKIALGY
ncbi:MAG TPA: hypothetical protein VF849_01545 [Blattabacteriaceae bacterium]